MLCNRLNASNYFLITYAVVTYWFCLKMMRLVLLMGGCVSALSAVAVGFAAETFAITFAKMFLGYVDEDDLLEEAQEMRRLERQGSSASAGSKGSKGDKVVAPNLGDHEKDKDGKRQSVGVESVANLSEISTPLSRKERRRRSSADSDTLMRKAMENNKLPFQQAIDQWQEIPRASRLTITCALMAVILAVLHHDFQLIHLRNGTVNL